MKHLGCWKAEIIPMEPDTVSTVAGKCVRPLFFVYDLTSSTRPMFIWSGFYFSEIRDQLR